MNKKYYYFFTFETSYDTRIEAEICTEKPIKKINQITEIKEAYKKRSNIDCGLVVLFYKLLRVENE